MDKLNDSMRDIASLLVNRFAHDERHIVKELMKDEIQNELEKFSLAIREQVLADIRQSVE